MAACCKNELSECCQLHLSMQINLILKQQLLLLVVSLHWYDLYRRPHDLPYLHHYAATQISNLLFIIFLFFFGNGVPYTTHWPKPLVQFRLLGGAPSILPGNFVQGRVSVHRLVDLRFGFCAFKVIHAGLFW